MLVQEINAIYYDPNIKHSIVQSNTNIHIKQKPIDVIEEICNRYGMSGYGSINAIKHTLKIHQKCPILVHPILQV